MKCRQVTDQSIDTDDNENYSIGWRNFPNMVTTSEDIDSNDTDGTDRMTK